MKKFLAALGLVVGLACSASFAQISVSRHNFSSYGWSGGEICKPCHTPHFAHPENGALWNHAMSSASYTLFDGSTGSSTDFDTRSRLCLGCHDGTVALDSFGGTTGINFIGPVGNLGVDFTNDHPVGKTGVYPTSGTSSSFNVATINTSRPTTATVGTSPNTLSVRQWIDATGATKYVVSCSSCHNVHNRGNYPHMLNFSNASSALCLTCHIK